MKSISSRAITSTIIAAAATLSFAACGGGGSAAGSFAGHAPTNAAPSGAKTTGRVTLTIPPAGLHTQSVSPATQSITILEGTTNVGSFDTTPTSPNCAPNNGATVCTLTVGLISGAQTFTVTAYDHTGGTGNVLSVGSVAQTIVVGQNNVIPLTLGGVVASAVVALTAPAPKAGSAGAVPVIVTAKDASGNVIVGSGNYSKPITLTNDDTTGATTLSTTTIAAPGASATLQYSGKVLSVARIGATVPGVATANITAASFAPVPTVLAAYNVPRLGSAVAIAYNAAPAGDGNIWFSTNTNYAGPNSLDQLNPTTGAITEFLAGTAPAGNLTSGTLGTAPISGIAAGPDGNLWLTTRSGVTKFTPAGAVTNFTTPNPSRIVVGPDGALWFTENANPAYIDRIPTNALTNANITRTLLTGTGYNANGLVLGKDGNIYVALQNGTPGIEQVVISGSAVMATNFLATAQTMTTSNNGNPPSLTDFQPVGITQSTDGDLWVTCSCSAYPESVERVHLNAAYASSTVTAYPGTAGGAFNTFLVATPDNSVWYTSDDFPIIRQIAIPANFGTPQFIDYNTPIQNGYPQGWDITIGPNGTLWMTNNNQGGNVVQFSY